MLNSQPLKKPAKTAAIKSLTIYPVKSLKGIAVRHATLTPQGLKGDREWMIVDEHGDFVTQRKYPAMGLIQVAVHETLKRTTSGGDAYENTLTLSVSRNLADKQQLQQPAVPVHPSECLTPCRVSIWGDKCQAFAAPRHISDWLGRVLRANTPLKLVYFDKRKTREADKKRFGQHSTFFADAAPLLVCNNSSLVQLNNHLEKNGIKPVEMVRFRPNIVIDTGEAFDEHACDFARLNNTSMRSAKDQPNQQTLKQQHCELRFVDHCQRCSIITINPQTAAHQDARALFNTLTALNPMPNNANAPAFGVNCVIENTHTAEGKCLPTIGIGDYLALYR